MTPACATCDTGRAVARVSLSIEMAKDPEKKSEYADEDERKVETQEEEVEEVTGLDRPTCPQCGWHDTRPSHTVGLLDSILRRFSLRAFRCRSCGSRFRAFRRPAKL